jgi:hypothetical protein
MSYTMESLLLCGIAVAVSYLGIKTWQTLSEMVSQDPLGCA